MRETGSGMRNAVVGVSLASFWLLRRPTIRVYPLSSVGCFPKAELLQKGKDLSALIIEQMFGFVKKKYGKREAGSGMWNAAEGETNRRLC